MDNMRTLRTSLFIVAASVLVAILALRSWSPAEEVSAPAPAAETERIPGQRTMSPDGQWIAAISEGSRQLVVFPAGLTDERAVHAALPVAGEVAGEVAFSPDGKKLVYPQRRGGLETDLMIAPVPPTGEPRVLVAWSGSEDRAVFSADGRRLAFVSGKTGVAALYVIDIAKGEASAVQVTNVGISLPLGNKLFVPPPESNTSVRWQGNELTWTSAGTEYHAQIPE